MEISKFETREDLEEYRKECVYRHSKNPEITISDIDDPWDDGKKLVFYVYKNKNTIEYCECNGNT